MLQNSKADDKIEKGVGERKVRPLVQYGGDTFDVLGVEVPGEDRQVCGVDITGNDRTPFLQEFQGLSPVTRPEVQDAAMVQ